MAGDIAEMLLDGTMDHETGEWNFDGEDGPGFPMTGAEAAAYRRSVGPRRAAHPTPAEQGALHGLWRRIALAIRTGAGTSMEIAAAVGAGDAKHTYGALATMRRDGLVHDDQGPWRLTKRGRARLQLSDPV